METIHFSTIQLDQMGQVKLMNRIDQKFWFHEERLQQILNSVSQHTLFMQRPGIIAE